MWQKHDLNPGLWALDQGFPTGLHVKTDSSGNKTASAKSSLAPLSIPDDPWADYFIIMVFLNGHYGLEVIQVSYYQENVGSEVSQESIGILIRWW